MDSLITAAAQALAAGDPLGTLQRVALRNDAPALALRGIAMSQLGDLGKARHLLRRAMRAFGPGEAVARARCAVAEAEIALAARNLGWPVRNLQAAQATLEAHGDRRNAAHAHCLQARRLLLAGRIEEAERTLTRLNRASLPPVLQTTVEMAVAGIALRRLKAKAARAALARAELAAQQARIPALTAEVQSAYLVLTSPAARLILGGRHRLVVLDEVEALIASGTLIVDACRHVIRHHDKVISLARRPVLFKLARALGEAWPEDVPRSSLIARAFRARRADESHRARLRVEIGRLRATLRPVAEVVATKNGFTLSPRRAQQVAVLALPAEEANAEALALLADGESWSSSALALALGTSQRTAQRMLDALSAAGKVQPFGHGRARRWTAPPVPGFLPILLLPGPLASA